MKNESTPKNKYICKHCGDIQERDSDKKWIKSICGKSGDKDVPLQLVESTPSEGWESPYCKRCQCDTDTVDTKCAVCGESKPSKCRICGKIFVAPKSNKGYYCSHECNNERLRRGGKRKPLSEEHKKKLSAIFRSVIQKTDVCYMQYHRRIYQSRGKATKCENCGRLDAKRYEWANVSGKLDDIYDYIQLCPSCHRKMDIKRRQSEKHNKLS